MGGVKEEKGSELSRIGETEATGGGKVLGKKNSRTESERGGSRIWERKKGGVCMNTLCQEPRSK